MAREKNKLNSYKDRLLSVSHESILRICQDIVDGNANGIDDALYVVGTVFLELMYNAGRDGVNLPLELMKIIARRMTETGVEFEVETV